MSARQYPHAPMLALAITLSLALLAAPLVSEAQQAGRVYRIGLFHVGVDHVPAGLGGLREGLTALGYEERRNIRLDWRNLVDEDAARRTADEFVRDRVDVLVGFEEESVRAAKAATSHVPVVFLHVLTDPVAGGFVASYPHPGGNLTGIAGDALAKRIQLLKELVPHLRRLLVLIDPDDPGLPVVLKGIRGAGAMLTIELIERAVRTQSDAEQVFGSLSGDVCFT